MVFDNGKVKRSINMHFWKRKDSLQWILQHSLLNLVSPYPICRFWFKIKASIVLYNFMKTLRTKFYTVTLQCIFVYCIFDITTMFKDVHGHQDLMQRCSHLGVLASAGTAEQSQIPFHSTVLSAQLNHLNEALQGCASSTGLLGNHTPRAGPSSPLQITTAIADKYSSINLMPSKSNELD